MIRAHETAITQARAAMRGELLLPGDTGYDQARQIWNAMIDRQPAMIARCRGVADVLQGLALAQQLALPLSVRGGGHNIAGSAVCDNGVMLDLSSMRSVRIDPEACVAYVEPGATLADLDHEAQAFGLATPLGINSTTGIAGLTLGGGFGWLTRKYGMTVDNLIAAEIVTADGKLLRASDAEHADLFWALRGGGGNFGIVTLFEFQLHPIGTEVLAGLVVFPFDQASAVLRQYRDFVQGMPEALNVWVILRRAPPLAFLPESVHDKPVVMLALCYLGEVEDGERELEVLRSFGAPCGEEVLVQPYCRWQQAFDPLLGAGARNYWKSHNFTALSDDLLDTLIRFGGHLPSRQSEILIALLAGKANTLPATATAYSHRDARFVINLHARWEEASDDAGCTDWARDCARACAPHATGGVYVNFLSEDESDRTDAAYGVAMTRLVHIKTVYDPENLFRANQNIKPGSG